MSSEWLQVEEPCWLIASGDNQRFEVWRSPLVAESWEMYSPVREFVARHGLVPVSQEVCADTGWMRGTVERTVYATA